MRFRRSVDRTGLLNFTSIRTSTSKSSLATGQNHTRRERHRVVRIVELDIAIGVLNASLSVEIDIGEALGKSARREAKARIIGIGADGIDPEFGRGRIYLEADCLTRCSNDQISSVYGARKPIGDSILKLPPAERWAKGCLEWQSENAILLGGNGDIDVDVGTDSGQGKNPGCNEKRPH